MQHGVLAELAGIDYLRDLARQLESTPHGRRGALITRAAEFMSCSEQTLRNRLRKVGFSPDRKLRSDAGDSRVPDAEVKAVAAIMISSQRANGKMLLPVCDAIEIALANAVLSVRVSTETMLRRMRQLSCHPQQLARPEPHVTMRSLHPNHVWQLDASICVIYYLRNGRVGVMDERNFNARKPANLAKVSNLRVMRYALTCHTSGSTFARYYMAAGENQHTLFEFLMEAMHARPGGVMHGVPWMLVWDAGAANLAHGIQGLLTALAIRHYAHIPGNPRAKGQIECTHNIIERKFEGRLTFTTIDSVEQLNDHLDTWLKSFNGADVHSRTGHTRWGVWQTIRPEQLRLCPPLELCRELLFAKPATRTVKGNLTISFALKGYGPAFYSVAALPDVRVGDQVTVTANPYRMPNVFVVYLDEHGATRYLECDPIAMDVYGFPVDAPTFGESFHSHADTRVEHARKEAYALAYGERETLEAQSAKAKGRVAFNGAIDPFKDSRERAAQVPTFMERRGTELHVPSPVQIELKPLSFVQALIELHHQLGRRLEDHEQALVKQLHPEGIPEQDLPQLLQRLLDPTPVAAPRLVAVK